MESWAELFCQEDLWPVQEVYEFADRCRVSFQAKREGSLACNNAVAEGTMEKAADSLAAQVRLQPLVADLSL